MLVRILGPERPYEIGSSPTLTVQCSLRTDNPLWTPITCIQCLMGQVSSEDGLKKRSERQRKELPWVVWSGILRITQSRRRLGRVSWNLPPDQHGGLAGYHVYTRNQGVADSHPDQVACD